MTAESGIACVSVFGGSGFLGREIVMRLVADGIRARVAVRHPDNVKIEAHSGQAAKIEPVYADVRDEDSVALAIKGCDAVVNAVGLYVERGAKTFEAVHELGALNVAHQCAKLGINGLVHISGIGADLYSRSSYIRSRAKGELLVMDVFPGATILRPSVLFGPGDKFVNAIADIARYTPVLPLFGRGATKLQPVFVGDVATAVCRALTHPIAPGKTFELGGPRTYSYRALIELILDQSVRRRLRLPLLLPLPFPIWDALAFATSMFSTPPVTPAQVTLMKCDNVVDQAALSFADLGINPTVLENILPHYAF